jgi:hypothetical protein
MTLISSIIADAFREGNILPLGTVPNALQSAEALRLLNAVFSAIYGDDAGEPLLDWPLGDFGRERAQYTLPESIQYPKINRRMIVTNEEPLTIYLTAKPQDGSRMAVADPLGRLATVPLTLDANGRTIEGVQTLLIDTDGTFSEWFYRADLGNWVRLTSKIETDEMPFAAEFDEYFITCLAMRINPRYGRTMDEQSIMLYKNQRRKFIARYLQSARLEIDDSLSWPFLSTQGYDQQREYYSSTNSFNSGNYWGGS